MGCGFRGPLTLAFVLFISFLAQTTDGQKRTAVARARPALYGGPCGEGYLNDPEIVPDEFNVRTWFGGGVQHFAPKPPCTPGTCWHARPACAALADGAPLRVHVTPPWALGHLYPPPATQQAGLQLLGNGSAGSSSCDGDSPLFVCVTNPEDACVTVVAGQLDDTEGGAISRLADSAHNVVVLNPGHWTEPGSHGHGDWPGLPFPTGRAALAMTAFMNGTIRLGFDIQMPCIPYPGFAPNGSLLRFKPEEVARADEGGRDVLLSFKGASNFAQIFTPWYMHRNILGNLHDPSGGVIIDLQCGDGTGEWTFGAAYEELLLRSKFGACPGGGGPSSYRLWETLAAGAVPVVINSTVLPFSGAADEAALGIQWDACVVRVWAVEEIAGLPARLRGMTLREFHRRRLACRSIFRRVAGTRQAYQRAFFTLLRARVQEALLAAAGGAPPAERGAEEEAGGRGGRHNGGGGGRRQQLRQHQQQEQFAGGGAGGGTA